MKLAIGTSDIRLGEIHRVMTALGIGMPDAIILLVLRRYGERHAEIRHKLDLLDISETDPAAAAEALSGVDLGPKGRG